MSQMTAPGVRPFEAQDREVYEIARSVLNRDFISPEEVLLARRGITYSEAQLLHFAETVPSLEVLTWCKENGAMLVPGPDRPLSLFDVRDLDLQYFSQEFRRIENWSLGAQDPLFRDVVSSTWIALRKEPSPGSLCMSFDEQIPFLPEEESVPNAAEVAWCATTYKAVTGVFLFPHVFVRTSSVDRHDARVTLGDFGIRNDGLHLYRWSDRHRSEFVGLASVRR